jgi:hypothetical protein
LGSHPRSNVRSLSGLESMVMIDSSANRVKIFGVCAILDEGR